MVGAVLQVGLCGCLKSLSRCAGRRGRSAFFIRRGIYRGNIIIGRGYKREGYSFQRYHLIYTVSVILLYCSQLVIHSIHPSGIAQLRLVVAKESWNS